MRNSQNLRNGNALLMVMVAAAIGAMVMFALSKLLSSSFKAVKATEVSSELQMIQQNIFNDIDCAGTFGAVAPNGGSCNSTSAVGGQDSAGVYLRLRRKTLDGSVKYFTGALSGNAGKIGDWSVRATCSSSEQSLVIRAARVRGNSFDKDFTGQTADWASPKGLLFGGASGSIPLCYGAAGGGAGVPKRFATLRFSCSVYNNSSEYIEYDLTGATPVVSASNRCSSSSATVTESFQTTGTMRGIVAMEAHDIRSNYYNVSNSSAFSITYPSPGKVRVQLLAMGDIGSGSAPFGSIRLTAIAFQM